jgi:hypothetical protein
MTRRKVWVELLRFAYVSPTETPIWDRLEQITAGNTLATFNGQPGGEWDPLRHTSLRRRQRITGAGLMSRWGEPPDVFADLLRRYAGQECEPDPIGWFIREAERATVERQAARSVDRRRRLAKRARVDSYYVYRDMWCRERGFASLWHYRKAMGWV